MKIVLILFGIVVIVASTLFFLWFSAMGCMSTTAIACHHNDFITMDAVYLFYLPVLIGLFCIVCGFRISGTK